MEREHDRKGISLFSLRSRLLFFTCLASLPAILFTFFVAANERSAAWDRIKREGLQLAVMTSREHAHQILGAREILLWLGTKVAAQGPQSPILTDPDFLRALLAGHPQLANLGALSPDGQVLASAYPLSNPRPWNDNPAYLAALNSPTVETGSYLISPIFDRPTLNHAYAVRDKAGRMITVLFDGLDLDWLSEMTRYTRSPYETSIFVTDREGHALTSSNPPSGETDPVRGYDLPNMIDLVRSQDGAITPLGPHNIRHYVVATALERTPGLYVAAAVPYDSIIAQANSTFYRTFIALGFLILFTITALFVATELGMLRRIHSLVRATRRLGAGDLAARAHVPRGNDDFSLLAKAFNSMADSLAKRNRETLAAQGQLRALAHRIQGAREEEAARISRELHDEMGQALTALKIDLSRIQSCCPDDNKPAESCASKLRQITLETTQRVTTLLGLVRRIASDLRPHVLDKLGLAEALQGLADEMQSRTDLAIRVTMDGNHPMFNNTVSLMLFRIAQEALTNVIRHAQADTVDISLVTSNDKVELKVRDNGTGIPTHATDDAVALGIAGMRERALLIGGKFSIHQEAEKGTVVAVTIPLPLENRS